MSPTPNHGYNTPSQGAQDWDQPLNQNFTDFDIDIEIRDTGTPSSNNYDPQDGAKYLDTDSGIIYEGDGNGWTAVYVLAAYDANNDEASFAPSVSASSFETGDRYRFSGNALFINSYTDGDDTDWLAVAEQGLYSPFSLFEVNQNGEASFTDDTVQSTAGPIAKGYINSDGSVRTGVNVDSATWNSGSSRYEISLTNIDFHYENQVTSITSTGSPLASSVGSVSGDIIVEFDGGVQENFTIVVYDIPDGN